MIIEQALDTTDISRFFITDSEYEIEYDGILSYPEWYAIGAYERSVEHSEFIINIPQDLKNKNKTYHFNGEYKESNENGINKHHWSVKNIKAFKSEPFSPDFSEIVPRVVATPIDFEMEGYSGTQDSWTNFGKWRYELITDRDILPIETIQKLEELTTNCNSDLEKIETLYKYMQSKTRYVGIQLGIGGWQPFPAETVDKLGYGDCKALTNRSTSSLRHGTS